MKNNFINYNRIFSIMIGTLLLAIATNGVLIPNQLLSGGVNGISMLLYFYLMQELVLLLSYLTSLFLYLVLFSFVKLI